MTDGLPGGKEIAGSRGRLWKTVETQPESQIFEEVRGAVATFAKAGPVGWRTVGAKPASDVGVLLALPFVQEQLASFDGDTEADANAAADAIEVAIKQAIDLLPSPYQEAAREQFGFGQREPDGTIPKQKEREERAARQLGRRSQRWYSQPNREHEGLQPRDYVAGLVATVLLGEPLGTPQPKPAQAAAAHEQPPARRGRRLSRRVAILASAGLLVLALAIATASGIFAAARSPHVPRPGSVVDASSGHVYPPGTPISPSTEPVGAIEGGSVLHGCDTSIAPFQQASSWETVPIARAGDLMRFRVLLKNRDNAPIPLVRVSASWEANKAPSVSTTLYWGAGAGKKGMSFSDSIEVLFTDHESHRLTYVPGSTAMYTQVQGQPEKLIARLPDGIMGSNGILLTNLGPPTTCFECINTYARVIEFSAHVV
ncbi:MAG TPA: hypothetical protein VES65_10465 [Solirubrobacteraceae bacterium]|nr:hypothetical protein [Solirubrobacteraceae bacterium]